MSILAHPNRRSALCAPRSPLARSDEANASAPAAGDSRGPGTEKPRSGSRGAEYAGGKETILVVEDDAAVREVTVYFLRKFGYRVLEADSGASALAVLEREKRTDLLLTDIVMPNGLQGDEIARLVRKRDPNIKVLYCSGNAQILKFGPEKSAPRTGQLHKPYRAKDLACKVRHLLDR